MARPGDPRRHQDSRISPRAIGVSIAAVFGLVALGILGYAVSAALRAPEEVVSEITAPNIPVLGENLSGEDVRIQFTDRDDPTRLAGEITLASLPAAPAGEYRIAEQPRIWQFLRDGRTLHISADRGRFVMPSATEPPDSGTLEGNVIIRLYEPLPGGRRPVVGETPPALTATTDAPLSFDQRLSRIDTPGRLSVRSDAVEFDGSGVTAVLNRLRNRIESLHVARGDRILYNPAARADEPEPAAQPAPGAPARPTSTAAGQPAPSATPAPPPSAPAAAPDPVATTLYALTLTDELEITHAGRTLTADRLDAHLRLVNNRLPDRNPPTPPSAPTASNPDGASASRSLAGPAATTPPKTAAAQEPLPPTLAAEEPTDPADADAPILITWSGPLTLDPLPDTALAEPPPELREDDIYLRFTAPVSEVVRFADAASDASGKAPVLEIAATREDVFLSGPEGSVALRSNDAGSLHAARVEIDMDAGIVTVPSAGVIAAAEADDGDAAGAGDAPGVAWSESARFVFETEDGRITDRITSAEFTGEVVAASADGSLRGSTLTTAFAAGADGSRYPARVDATDAEAADAAGGTLASDGLTLELVEDPSTDEGFTPRRLTATGAVRAATEGRWLEAEELSADLAPDADGNTSVERLLAAGEVRFEDGEGARGLAERLEARPGEETATLFGSRTRVAEVERDGARVTGPRIDLDGRSRSGEVLGAGTFSARREPAPGETPDAEPALAITARWNERMVFDDAAGDLRLYGGVEALHTPDGLTRDRVTGDRLLVRLAPASEGEASDGERQVLEARVLAGDAPDAVAEVEARRYDPLDPERLEQLLFLRSRDIKADNVVGTLVAPGPGRLLVLDRRAAEADEGPERAGVLGGDARGQALFTWQGGMALDREASEAVLTQDVRVTHQRASDGLATVLRADRVIAVVSGLEGEGGEAGRGELERAEALGSVYVRSGDKELVADRALYDASGGVVLAEAVGDGLVTLLDPARASPVQARRLRWDLVTDRITVDEPAPVVGPR